MTQSYFTDSEWSILMQAPTQALSAVILSDKSDPVAFIKEVKAAVQIMLAEQQRDDLSTDLGRSLMQSFRNNMSAEHLQGEELLMKKVFEYLGGIANLKSASEGRKQAINHLNEVSKILAEKVTVVQANEFRQWLTSLSRKVAESVKEEGFLGGIGGERISSQEASTLRDIEKALQV